MLLPELLIFMMSHVRCTVLPESLVLWSLMIRPPVLNADSNATVDAGKPMRFVHGELIEGEQPEEPPTSCG